MIGCKVAPTAATVMLLLPSGGLVLCIALCLLKVLTGESTFGTSVVIRGEIMCTGVRVGLSIARLRMGLQVGDRLLDDPRGDIVIAIFKSVSIEPL